jgi:hypothetical protein
MKLLHSTYLILVIALTAWLSGCGGGGTTNQSGSGLVGSTSKSGLKLSMQELLGLTSSQVLTEQEYNTLYSIGVSSSVMDVDYQVDELIGVSPSISPDLNSYLTGNQIKSISRATSSLSGRVSKFRITVTGPGIAIPYVQEFPGYSTQATLYVESGLSRSILIEAIGIDIDGTEKVLIKGTATVDLAPSTTVNLGTGSDSPEVTFEIVDTNPPITAVFHAGSGLVEGPHMQAVDIILSNFEDAVLYYKVSEKNNPNSTLIAVTSGFKTAVSTVTVSLNEEAVYLFEYYSVDNAGNQENLNEKEITVNFNSNPPKSVIQYSGSPYKMFSGSTLWMSVDMTAGLTGVLHYQLEGESGEATSPELKSKEAFGLTVGAEGIIPTDGIYTLQYWAEVLDGSVELTKNTTEIYVKNMVNSEQTKFEGSASSVLSTGTVPFCDTDSGSIYVRPDVCGGAGKLVLLETGPFSPGNAVEYPCFTVQENRLVMNTDTSCSAACTPQEEGEDVTQACYQCISTKGCVDCTSYKAATGLDCPGS